MSELSFGTEVAEAEEAGPGRSVGRPGEPGTLAVSAGEFAALEERVLRAVNLVKREKLARAEAEERATAAELKASEQSEAIAQLQKEIGDLRSEREAVKQRVGKLVAHLDALEA
ncbi:MAG TPA: hypothetical protein VKB38_08235 [Terracidiphilus sp.]|nr:hypothetical protein [Terracidiphilus sp.]